MRNRLDGLFYLLRTGRRWRELPMPPAFPPWRTVFGYMHAILRDGVWESIRHQFVVMLHEDVSRDASPTAAMAERVLLAHEHGEGGASALARRFRIGLSTL
jgi:putative transposase